MNGAWMRRWAMAAAISSSVAGMETARADGACMPGVNDFAAWQNRPREAFKDGDRAFQKVKEILHREYVDDQLSDDDLFRAATAGMLAGAGGRQWDKLLTPSEVAEMKHDLAGELVGIGLEIRFDPESGVTTVIGVIPGGPAERGGVAPGDRILKLDGKSYKGLQTRDVVYAMRGKAGESVSLTILRDDRVQVLPVKREALAFSPVTEAILDDGVGLVSIRSFTEKTPALLKASLSRLQQKQVRALVVDVRGDQGGLFEKMLDCASLLLPRGSLVVTRLGRGGKESVDRTAGEPAIGALPMAVLINGETASGAEVLAGALHHAGARLVGMRTRGKWNVQRIEELPNGYALKYTFGVFRSADGALLDGKGQEPDIEVDVDEKTVQSAQRVSELSARMAADAQLRAAVGLFRSPRK